jgi:ankyrin
LHLLAKGASTNAANVEGMTPVMLATEWDGAETLKLLDYLLQKGADVRLRDKNGHAALDHAARRGNDAAAKHLLDSGASAIARDAQGYSALHRARTRKVAEMLVAAGASVRLAAADGKTPLHLAAKEDEPVVGFLLEQGADVNAVDKSGQTPLYASVGRESIFRKLLEAGAAVAIVDNEGRTPLHYAAAVNSEVTRTLVGKGVSLAAKDKLGNTPLHEAARLNRGYFVQELIKLGADPGIKNRAGKTAMDLAEEAARAQAQKSFTNSTPSAGALTDRRSLRSR